MTLEWTATANGGWTATGLQWTWELLPHTSELWPRDPDSWVLRGRPIEYNRWKYFGAYKGLDNARNWVQRMNNTPVLRGNYWNDDEH